MGDRVAHFEIHTPDNEASGKFYAELFGWHVQTFPMEGGDPYVLVDTHGGQGVNGGIAKSQDGKSTHTMFYIEVPSPKATLEKLEKAGAKTLMPETEIPGVVTLAMFTDPAGNVTGLVKGGSGDEGAVSAGSDPPVDWFEIMTAKPEELSQFYAEQFGWTAKKSEFAGAMTYIEMNPGVDGAVGGGIGQSPDGTNMVLVYAKVDDLTKYLERAESLGSKTVMGPMDVGGQLTVAAFADPQGVIFGMFQDK